MSRLFGLGGVFVALAHGPAALACAVCSDPESVSNLTFGLSTAFLTFLPLIAMGSLGWWGWRRFKLLEAAQALGAPTPLHRD